MQVKTKKNIHFIACIDFNENMYFNSNNHKVTSMKVDHLIGLNSDK